MSNIIISAESKFIYIYIYVIMLIIHRTYPYKSAVYISLIINSSTDTKMLEMIHARCRISCRIKFDTWNVIIYAKVYYI